MRQTKNLGLSLIDTSDKVSLDPINANMEQLEEVVLQRHMNLLDNWYFADPVDQRGGYVVNGVPASQLDEGAVRGYANYGHTIDRWQLTSANGTLTIEDDGVALSGQKGAIWLAEYLDAGISKRLYGTQLTVSVIADGSLYSATGIVQADSVTANTSQFAVHYKNGYCALFKAANGEIFVSLNAAAGQTVKYTAVKLELGAEQTLARKDADENWVLNDPPPNKELERIKCCISAAEPADTYANNRKTYGALGCARVVTGSYTGTGACGRDNPCTLTFDFKPRVLLITRSAGMLMPDGTYFTDGIASTELRGMAMFTSDETKWYGGAYTYTTEIGGYSYGADLLLNFEWGDNSVSWYGSIGSGNTSDNASKAQFNGSGTKYYYVAIG